MMMKEKKEEKKGDTASITTTTTTTNNNNNNKNIATITTVTDQHINMNGKTKQNKKCCSDSNPRLLKQERKTRGQKRFAVNVPNKEQNVTMMMIFKYKLAFCALLLQTERRR